MNTWSKMCDANINHYNDHPEVHTAIAVGTAIGGIGLMMLVARKLAKSYDAK